MEQKEMNKSYKKVRNIIILVVLFIIIGIVVRNCITVVPSGYTGVVVTLGKVTGVTFADGMHFKAPFVTRVEIMDNQIQKSEVETSAVSKDMQTVESSLAVNYHLSAEQSADVYKTLGNGYVDKILSPAVHEATKAVMAKYSAEQLITQRSAVSIEIHDALTAKVSEYGLIVDELNITNFDFSAEYNAAIEAKQVAEQNKIKANTEKEQRVIEAEAAASERTIAAKAEADAIKAKATAEAEAIKVKAEAEAEANRKIAQSLTDEVLRNKSIEKWDGQYPRMVAGNGTDMLISINGGEQTAQTE
ncbi:MAG: prohibitin family protein [Oscillospiraceae bacterium]|nr:prohibitin family protein [Oscillospiraceae bacterium]